MKVTVLGCGPSGGVPTVAGNWGNCDPDNPKNRRRRPSILLQKDGFNLLIDTSPDLRAQLLDCRVNDIHAVIYTHEHADHVMGIDDLRGIYRHTGRQIDVWAAPPVLGVLKHRFGYLFEGVQDRGDLYRPILRPHEFDGLFEIAPFGTVVPFEQDHGICTSWGFRFGDFAYSTDVVRLDGTAFDALRGIRTWIVDCLRDGDEHPTHANLATTLSWIERLGVERALLTHMNHQADYETMRRDCPAGVAPAHDGMTIEV